MVRKENLERIKISSDRLNHIIAVARKMQFLSEKLGLDAISDDMFVLGFLHDVGYEFAYSKEEHPTIGGLLLKSNKYKYYNEVYYHGKVQDEYNSKELDLLNYCDMTVSPKGDNVTLDERLNDIKLRFGEESNTYTDAKAICSRVRYIENLIR